LNLDSEEQKNAPKFKEREFLEGEIERMIKETKM
jgi:hypothetical protein